jgi:hypothetical protein
MPSADTTAKISPTTAPTLNTAECLQFTRFWAEVTGVKHITLVAIVPDGGTTACTFAHGDKRLGEWIKARQETGCNVYFQPNETRPDCASKPGKADMQAALCRFADIDPCDGDHSYTDERDRLKKLADNLAADPEFPPTAIIDSGNGMQPIWAVKRLALSPAAIARIEGETKAIEDALGAGGTHNVDRLLRLPGTVNFPNKKKLALGRVTSRARLIFSAPNLLTETQAVGLATHLSARLPSTGLVRPKPVKADKVGREPSGQTGDDEQRVTALITQLRDAGAAQVFNVSDLSAPLRKRLQAALTERKQLACRWAGEHDDLTDEWKDDSRSGADFSLASMLKFAGFSYLDTGLILCAFQHGKAAEDWSDDAMRLRQVARSALRSRQPEGSGADGNQEESPVKKQRIRLLSISELKNLPDPEWLIEGLLPEKSLSLIFGQPKNGKTFIALSEAMHIAAGRDWFGRKVKQGVVIYVAAEGSNGLKLRIPALQAYHKFPDDTPFYTVPLGVNFGTNKDVLELVGIIRETVGNQPVALVVVDTLAKSMPGLDENAAVDMGRVIAQCEWLRDELGCAVMPIHHEGKDATKGARGNTALPGAVDSAQHVCRVKDKGNGTDIVVVTNTAQKDAAEADPILFDLIEVAGDETRASLVPVLRTTAAPAKVSEISGQPAIALTELNCMLTEHPTPLPKEPNYPVAAGAREDDWRERFYAKLPSDTKAKVKGQAFNRARNTLMEKKIIDVHKGWVWLMSDVEDFDAVTDPGDMADLVAEPAPAVAKPTPKPAPTVPAGKPNLRLVKTERLTAAQLQAQEEFPAEIHPDDLAKMMK